MTGVYREQQQREATAARIRKAEDEKQVMSWLLRQQMILKEVVRLSAEIIMAEAFKAGFPIGRQDVASAEDLDEDLEGHTIFVSQDYAVHSPNVH